MRRRVVVAGTVLAGLLGLSLAAWAFGPWGGRSDWHAGLRMRHGPRLMALLDSTRVRTYLGLTDPQVVQLRKILVDAEKATVKDRADIAVRGIELRELLRADNPDHDAVMQKVQEISQLRERLMNQHVEALLAAKKVLTPEQQKKVRSFIESRGMRGSWQGRSGEQRGGWMHRPTPPAAPAHPEAPPAQ